MEAADTLRVRLLDASSCGVLIAFDAAPGSRHVITVTDDGATTRSVEEVDAGPALEPSALADCLPDTAAGPVPVGWAVLPALPLLAAGIALVFLGAILARVTRRH